MQTRNVSPGFYDGLVPPPRDDISNSHPYESLEREVELEMESNTGTVSSTQQLLQHVLVLESTNASLRKAHQSLISGKSKGLDRLEKEAQDREFELEHQRDLMNEEWMLGLAFQKRSAQQEKENQQLKRRLSLTHGAVENMAQQFLLESFVGVTDHTNGSDAFDDGAKV